MPQHTLTPTTLHFTLTWVTHVFQIIYLTCAINIYLTTPYSSQWTSLKFSWLCRNLGIPEMGNMPMSSTHLVCQTWVVAVPHLSASAVEAGAVW